MPSPSYNADEEDSTFGSNIPGNRDIKGVVDNGNTMEDELITVGPGSTPTNANLPQIERRINIHGFKYRVEQLLGSGGFAEVYSAYDRSLRRYVAFKISKMVYANRRGRKKFLREARTIAQLDHPHILPIYDIGLTHKGEAFVVSKLISSGDLSRAMALKGLTRCEMISITASIAEALHHAHTHAVIHRDVKPANILLDENKHPYLTDFGLAISENVEVDGSEIAGTIPYMSPEQASGQLCRIDQRSDVYSLGVVLYEMLTERRPFGGTNQIDLINRIVQGNATPLREFNDTIPKELEQIVLKSMSRRMDDRYLTAMDFAKDLRAFLVNYGKLEVHKPVVDKDKIQKNMVDADIVISFAQIDDVPFGLDECGWVTSFQKRVSLRVEQLLGESVRILPLGFDRVSQIDESTFHSVESAKIFIAVFTPSYVKNEGCRRIVERFADVISKKRQCQRLIKIVKNPVDLDEIPSEFNSIFFGVEDFLFFEQDESMTRISELAEGLGRVERRKYFAKVNDVSDAIHRVLKDCCSASTPVACCNSPAGPVVYLAETTSDLASERSALKQELLAMGCTVFPIRSFAHTLCEVESQVSKDMLQTSLCIHPLGALYGFIPEGTDQSIIAIQYRIAATSKRPQIVWIPRDLPIKEPRQEALIGTIRNALKQSQNLEIMECRLAELKDHLFKKLHQLNLIKRLGR